MNPITQSAVSKDKTFFIFLHTYVHTYSGNAYKVVELALVACFIHTYIPLYKHCIALLLFEILHMCYYCDYFCEEQ
jgi:hypothetical protein